MDGTLNHLTALFQFVDEFEQTMDRNYIISVAPGIVIIGGVYLLHLGIAASMGIFYLSCFAGLGNVLLPLVKHQQAQDNLLEGEVEDGVVNEVQTQAEVKQLEDAESQVVSA